MALLWAPKLASSYTHHGVWGGSGCAPGEKLFWPHSTSLSSAPDPYLGGPWDSPCQWLQAREGAWSPLEAEALHTHTVQGRALKEKQRGSRAASLSCFSKPVKLDNQRAENKLMHRTMVFSTQEPPKRLCTIQDPLLASLLWKII